MQWRNRVGSENLNSSEGTGYLQGLSWNPAVVYWKAWMPVLALHVQAIKPYGAKNALSVIGSVAPITYQNKSHAHNNSRPQWISMTCLLFHVASAFAAPLQH